jgi:hypothetical protein
LLACIAIFIITYNKIIFLIIIVVKKLVKKKIIKAFFTSYSMGVSREEEEKQERIVFEFRKVQGKAPKMDDFFIRRGFSYIGRNGKYEDYSHREGLTARLISHRKGLSTVTLIQGYGGNKEMYEKIIGELEKKEGYLGRN